ncbi:hypothetical protein JCM39068_26370 [Desulfocastanea catecholica]
MHDYVSKWLFAVYQYLLTVIIDIGPTAFWLAVGLGLNDVNAFIRNHDMIYVERIANNVVKHTTA